MRYEDDLWVCKQAQDEYDWRGYPQEQPVSTSHFGKCFLSFNSAAQRVVMDDGKEYQYSFYAIAPLTKALYPLIPKSGERVIVRKADGTVFTMLEVRGSVTYKKRFLKLWGSQVENISEQELNTMIADA